MFVYIIASKERMGTILWSSVKVKLFLGFCCIQVAESRKNLVDEMAIDKQTAETNHKQQMDKLQEEHKVRLI